VFCRVERRLLAGVGQSECLDVQVMPSGYTAFMIACRDGSTQIVRKLIETGCSTALTTNKGQTGWDIAKLGQQRDVCSLTHFGRALLVTERLA
jgi:ankyrin repeat protein